MEIRQIQSYLSILQQPTGLPKEYKLMVAEHALDQLRKNRSTEDLKGEAKKLQDVAEGILASIMVRPSTKSLDSRVRSLIDLWAGLRGFAHRCQKAVL